MKRRFECFDGESAKFWEIERRDASYTVRHAELGAGDTSEAKVFADAFEAERSANEQISAALARGYVEVVELAAASAPAIDAGALAKLDADASPEARQVFGDWLQSIGHPWGELISLDHAGKHAERDALLVNPALLGALARRSKLVSFTWRQGFIDEATISSGGNATILMQCLQALFELPIARCMRRLVLDGAPHMMTTTRDWDSDQERNIAAPFRPQVMRELAKAPKTLTELAFGTMPPRGASAYVHVPSLSDVTELLPNLEVLELQGAGGSCTPVRFAKLRRLELRFANAEDDDLRAVIDSELPALERLSIWLGADSRCTLDDVYGAEEIEDWDEYEAQGHPLRYPERYESGALDAMSVYSARATVSSAAIRELCEADWPASLTQLGIQSAVLDDDALAAILGSKLVSRLTHLDLSGGTLGDKQAALIIRHAKQLAHLEVLDLRRNHLDKQAKKLAAVLPNADCREQRKGQAPEFLFRYVATME